MDTWTDKLSEYIDGDLDAGTTAALEQHLSVCDDCRHIVAELRMVVTAAGSLQDSAPAKDLWSVIARAIETPAHNLDTVVIDLAKRRAQSVTQAPRHSLTLTWPQLAAAAVILLAIGGALVTQLRPATQTAAAGRDTPTTVINAADTRALPMGGYDAAIRELEDAAARTEGTLDPETIRVLEQSMKTIDKAIDDARAALASDPANPYLNKHLDRTMKQKLELLQRAAGVRRGGA